MIHVTFWAFLPPPSSLSPPLPPPPPSSSPLRPPSSFASSLLLLLLLFPPPPPPLLRPISSSSSFSSSILLLLPSFSSSSPPLTHPFTFSSSFLPPLTPSSSSLLLLLPPPPPPVPLLYPACILTVPHCTMDAHHCRLRSACALIHADSKDSDHIVSIYRLIWVMHLPILARFLEAWTLSYPLCCCENTGQIIIKRRCSAWCSYHLTLNLLVSSTDKLYKKFDKRSDMLSGLIWIQTVWHSLIIFQNRLEVDQTEHYTLTVINLYDLVTAPSVVLPEEFFFLEYSSD